MKKIIKFWVLINLCFSSAVSAKALLVSDIDDTIKISHVLDEKVSYAYEHDSRFKGMSELYQLIVQQFSKIQVTYLSAAPKWLMKKSHVRFLENGNFPIGDLILRGFFEGKSFKETKLRKLINKEKPDVVFLFGDNGERDIDVFHKIYDEFRGRGIEFYVFIHLDYSSVEFNEVLPLHPEQVGFVTPLEVTLELARENLISENISENFVVQWAPSLLQEENPIKYSPMFFPNWLNCEEFEWIWSREGVLELVHQKILNACST